MGKRAPAEVSMDMTPMIDVVFQLMIFFLVTINMDQEQLLKDLVLPPSYYSKEQKTKDPFQLTIQVSEDGKYYLGNQPVNIQRLRVVLQDAVRRVGAPNLPVLIRGDKDARHKAIRDVMDSCSELGIYKIRFAGLKRSAGEPPGAPTP